MRRAFAAACLGALALVPLTGCGRSRAEYEADFKQLVMERGDLPPAQVDCVIDGFFSDMSTAEVRAFSERDELTPTEAMAIRDWTTRCRSAG